MKEKNEVEEAVNNYVRLQEREKEIKGLLAYWRAQLMKTIEEQQGLPIKVGNTECSIKERISYKYNPEKLKEAIGNDAAKLVIVESVDVKRLKGLIKGGIVSEVQTDHAKEVTKRVKALIVETKEVIDERD